MENLSGSSVRKNGKKKTVSTSNVVTSKLLQISDLKFVTIPLKPITKLCQNSKLVSFQLTEEETVKERYGRDGPVHHGNRLYGQ